jgi:hypothetical protein
VAGELAALPRQYWVRLVIAVHLLEPTPVFSARLRARHSRFVNATIILDLCPASLETWPPVRGRLEQEDEHRVWASVSDDEAHLRYFADRELAERAMSRSATSPRAAAVHREMAERYEALAVVFGAKPLAKLSNPQEQSRRSPSP